MKYIVRKSYAIKKENGVFYYHKEKEVDENFSILDTKLDLEKGLEKVELSQIKTINYDKFLDLKDKRRLIVRRYYIGEIISRKQLMAKYPEKYKAIKFFFEEDYDNFVVTKTNIYPLSCYDMVIRPSEIKNKQYNSLLEA